MNDSSGQPRELASGRSAYWPRRLLHIPSLHSYEKREGNYYGQTHQPAYATISYTWGRYVTLAGKAIPITGVPWRLPGVQSEHFTVENFANAIKAIRSISNVEFLWLDVACVDMADWSANDNEEISMQRDIFRGAAQSFVWLSRTEASSLTSILERMQDVDDSVIGSRVKNNGLKEPAMHVLKQATPIFDMLLADPWFSSLWTLQEAMASPTSILLSTEGCALPLPTNWRNTYDHVLGCILLDKDRAEHDINLPYETLTPDIPDISNLKGTRYATLIDLVYLSQSIRDAANFLATVPTQAATGLCQLRQKIEYSGLSSFASYNLLHMWKVAQHRNEMHTGDRLEYIQRYVLGYPCGPTASPPPDPRAYFGNQFLYHFPVLSQLFVRAKIECSPSCSWHLDTASEFPELDFLFTCFQQYIPLVETRSAAHADGRNHVAFMGQSYPAMPVLEDFLSSASKPDSSRPRLLGIVLDESRITATEPALIIPVTCALPTKQPSQSLDSKEIWTIPSPKQMNLALDMLRQQTGYGNEIHLLPLAYAPGYEESGISLVIAAIVLSIEQGEKWKRLGWCFWVYAPSDRGSHELDAKLEGNSCLGIYGITKTDVGGMYV